MHCIHSVQCGSCKVAVVNLLNKWHDENSRHWRGRWLCRQIETNCQMPQASGSFHSLIRSAVQFVAQLTALAWNQPQAENWDRWRDRIGLVDIVPIHFA